MLENIKILLNAIHIVGLPQQQQGLENQQELVDDYRLIHLRNNSDGI